jgi:hypothetical protein
MSANTTSIASNYLLAKQKNTKIVKTQKEHHSSRLKLSGVISNCITRKDQ